MKEVFISHVEEDADLALKIALSLELAGYSTWCYEVDSVPGPTYFHQTRSAVAQAKVVVVIISPRSIGSQQITRELVRAFELNKFFIPILRDITHAEFQDTQPEWRDILGAAASIRVPAEGLAALAPRIVQGLHQLGVPSAKPDPARVAEMEAIAQQAPVPPAQHQASLPTGAPPRPRPLLQRAGSILGKRFRIAMLSVVLVASVASIALFRLKGPEPPKPKPSFSKPTREKPLAVGVMTVHAKSDVPKVTLETARDRLNTVLSKVESLHVYSKQMIDWKSEKLGVSEIEVAEGLGIEMMLSGAMALRDGKVTLDLEAVDVRSGILRAVEHVEGSEARLIELLDDLAIDTVQALKVQLSSDELKHIVAFRDPNQLESLKLLTETLGVEEGEETRPKPPPRGGAWWKQPWVAEAHAGESIAEETAVRHLLEEYRAALEEKDLDRLAAIQEGMSESQRQALVRYFENAGRLKVEFSNFEILVEGDEALATFTRNDVFNDVRSGRDMHLEVRVSSVLAKQDGGWRIRALRKPS